EPVTARTSTTTPRPPASNRTTPPTPGGSCGHSGCSVRTHGSTAAAAPSRASSDPFSEPLRPRLRNLPMHVAMRRPAILSRHQFGMPATDDLPPRLPRMVLVPPPAEVVLRRTGRFRQLRPIGRVGVAPHTVTCAADQPRRGGCVSGPIRFAVHHPVVEGGEHFHGVERSEFAGDTVGVGPRVRWGEVGVDRFDQFDELILSHRASPPELSLTGISRYVPGSISGGGGVIVRATALPSYSTQRPMPTAAHSSGR